MPHVESGDAPRAQRVALRAVVEAQSGHAFVSRGGAARGRLAPEGVGATDDEEDRHRDHDDQERDNLVEQNAVVEGDSFGGLGTFAIGPLKRTTQVW